MAGKAIDRKRREVATNCFPLTPALSRRGRRGTLLPAPCPSHERPLMLLSGMFICANPPVGQRDILIRF